MNYRDDRSEAVKLQHKLFQELGTLCRTRANLRNILQEHNRLLTLQESEQLKRAVAVLENFISDKKWWMKNIPPELRKKKVEKEISL